MSLRKSVRSKGLLINIINHRIDIGIGEHQKYKVKISFWLFAFSIFAPLFGAMGTYLVQVSTNSGFYPVFFAIGGALLIVYFIDFVLFRSKVGYRVAFTPFFFSLLFVVFIGSWLFGAHIFQS